jgi:hypothetical protein
MDVITQAGITIGERERETKEGKRDRKNIFTVMSDWRRKKFKLKIHFIRFEIELNSD